MFISKKHLSRRTLLRGAGAAVSLPLLDAMIPAYTALADTAAAPKPKLGFIYFPHGAVMDRWTPAKDGRDFDVTPILQPLAPFQKQMTIVSGLGNRHADGPVHAITPGTWLSCVTPRETQDPFGGVTADQIAAQHIGQDTPLPSLEVAAEGSSGAGGCDRNYGCGFGGTISFRTPTTPLPMESNPRLLFERLFGQGDSPAERAAISRQYGSILDMVMEQAGELRRGLGAQDRAMLDDYLETVWEIERRVHKMGERDLSHLNLPDVPMGIPDTVDERITLMFDIIALAYQAGLTRVASFMMAAEGSNTTYNHVRVPDAFHPLSHHQNNPDKIERLVRIQVYHSEVFAKFVAKLAAMPDGDGSMLDHAILLYGSNMSNSNLHNHAPLPNAIVGGGCGALKGNQHIRCKENSPLSNLLLTVLHRAGVDIEQIGDSTGPIAEV